MRLMHYSDEPFTFDPTRTYENKRMDKPGGLWVSVEGPDDWPTWLTAEQWRENWLNHCAEVVLDPDARIYRIDSLAAMKQFCEEYGGPDAPDLIYRVEWNRLAQQYAGIIIAPYRWDCRLTVGFYYGWDCACGVIWDMSAIKETRTLEGTKK